MVIVKMKMLLFFYILLLIQGCTADNEPNITENKHPIKDAFFYNEKLKKTINLANTHLEASEDDKKNKYTPIIIKKSYFKDFKQSGITAVRVPIAWSHHYTGKLEDDSIEIDEDFFKDVDAVLNQGLDQGLTMILDFHNYKNMKVDLKNNLKIWLKLWEQIAEHYKDYPDNVYFELLNEPDFESSLWNDYLKLGIDKIRETNPDRIIIVGSANKNYIKDVNKEFFDSLPADDNNIIVTFHYYDPFDFTHQGLNKPIGVSWFRDNEKSKAMADNFTKVSTIAKINNRPLFMGEFGVYNKADMQQRIQWTKFVRELAEKYKISWAYWEFGKGFGFYDPNNKCWKKGLIESLGLSNPSLKYCNKT